MDKVQCSGWPKCGETQFNCDHAGRHGRRKGCCRNRCPYNQKLWVICRPVKKKGAKK